MGACATKPKVSKDEANAPVTRELEPEATEKLIDAKQMETSATTGGEKDELATEEVEAKEPDPPESAMEEDKKTPTTVETKEAEHVEESEESTTAAKEEAKPEVAAAVSISLIEKPIESVEQVKTEQAAEKSAAAHVAEEEPKVQTSIV